MHTVDHTQTIIGVSDVSFSYDGKTDALSRVSLEVHRGDYVGLIGPNGAGKTTLLKVMLGLLVPRSGSVELFGKDAATARSLEKVGYVPQKATHFDARFPATVFEIVLMGRYGMRGMFHSVHTEDKQAALDALERVGMAGEKNRLIGELSGGQQQRVFIARALASNPEILFLDEPTTGIDRAAEEELYTLLQTLNRTLDITLVLVSHDVARVAREAMHIACIDHTLTCYMTPEAFTQEAMQKNGAGFAGRFV